ncbi:MAG: hypothetical protein HY076_06605 [Candidatus Eisenbacteria bacterium]|uniref:Uncharacterized protein n=1 Tax=Eiseniibacteriota bacterium TaxID=2212470 RepID=A0A9D6L792_UNCEI|nr:hypothetical protein [Candidatus Eisenbacteria bacterium]MBI3539926.1 hypothetical protein [Candidatus Eisenbacteria bacterium]
MDEPDPTTYVIAATRAPFPQHGIGADAPAAASTARAPERTHAWLHVVSGHAPEVIARGAFELAARFLARRHRVLIVDAGPRLHLHRRFARESRWGVVECLTGTLPVLGLVQDTGRLGLYLLAYGTPTRVTQWPQLGRLLDEAKQCFSRVVLAFETDAPEEIGAALAGRHLEGWWAGDAPGDRRRERLVGRIGVPLEALAADTLPRATLDQMDQRLWALAADHAIREALKAMDERDAPVVTAAPPARPPASDEPPGFAAPRVAAAPPAPAPAEPATMGCDPRVRERLRFLLWMRRLGSEGADAPRPVPVRRSAREPVGAGDRT